MYNVPKKFHLDDRNFSLDGYAHLRIAFADDSDPDTTFKILIQRHAAGHDMPNYHCAFIPANMDIPESCWENNIMPTARVSSLYSFPLNLPRNRTFFGPFTLHQINLFLKSLYCVSVSMHGKLVKKSLYSLAMPHHPQLDHAIAFAKNGQDSFLTELVNSFKYTIYSNGQQKKLARSTPKINNSHFSARPR